MSSLWLLFTRLGILLAIVVSLVIVRRLDSHNRVAALRTRFLAGVPWGTVITVCGVLAVYLFVQGGFTNWFEPVVLPFRAWSYLYPLGMVLAPFSHAGPNHLMGNLVGTLVLAPVAEYAWGHFPTERGSQSFSSLRTNPYARVLAVPAVVVLGGLFTSLFALGPIIGFSGVVFAFAGFALVRYPLGTVIAFSASAIFGLIYDAIRNPVVEASADPSFGGPWWAGIAIQTHAIGLLLGVLVGIAVFRRREGRPAVGRLWLGTLIFAVGQSLWAVYWFRGNDTFVLFRAVGAVLVFALAVLVAASVAASGRFSRGALVSGVERRQVAALVLVLSLTALSAPAIPVNLLAFDTTDEALVAGSNPGPDNTISVRDYTVTYAENVTNQLVSVLDISVLGETTTVNASGVIVESERRHIWTTAVSEDRLAFAGEATVRLGGLGWRETIRVTRNGWAVVGGENAYLVRFRQDGRKQLAYLSEPATAALTIRGKNVSVVPRQSGFWLAVSRHDRVLARVPLPENGTTRAANLTFSREGERLFVSAGKTRVRVAEEETYQ